MKTKDVKLNFFKSVGNFFFFSFTKVETKHVCQLAYNVRVYAIHKKNISENIT